jgi:hypothetical protein
MEQGGRKKEGEIVNAETQKRRDAGARGTGDKISE